MGACCAPAAPAAAQKSKKRAGPTSTPSGGSKLPYIAKMKVLITKLLKDSKSFKAIVILANRFIFHSFRPH